MKGFHTELIVIEREHVKEFLDSLRRPDIDYLQRKNAIFDEMDSTMQVQYEGMDIEVEIQDLDLSFIDDEIDEVNDWNEFGDYIFIESFDMMSCVIKGDDIIFSNVGDTTPYVNFRNNTILNEVNKEIQLELAA